jgi:HAD superfamily hydrolase (TIGR01509 family)
MGIMDKPAAAVLFDVDGTLIDTNYLHAVTWWETFAKAGHDVGMADIHRAIGMGSDKLLDALLPARRDRDEDSELAAGHDALFSVYWSRLRPLPGAADLVRACKSAGLRVVLASSAGQSELQAMRAALDAEDAIDEVTSSADVGQTKPAPDIVQVALAKADIEPARAVFVGDTVWDVKACRQAGVHCIAVLTGGISRDELAGAGADEIFAGPGQLLAELGASSLAVAAANGRSAPAPPR